MNFSGLRFWSSLLGVLLPILLIRPFFIRLSAKILKRFRYTIGQAFCSLGFFCLVALIYGLSLSF